MTEPHAPVPRPHGRSYAIPFGRVWQTALRLAGSLPRWRVVSADPRRGWIRAESRRLGRRTTDTIDINISLDPVGLTRVELVSASRARRLDLGAQSRRIGRFVRELDRALRSETP